MHNPEQSESQISISVLSESFEIRQKGQKQKCELSAFPSRGWSRETTLELLVDGIISNIPWHEV